MRKSLLKSVVAVAVVGATMAITSVAAMAATTTFTAAEFASYDDGKAIFTDGNVGIVIKTALDSSKTATATFNNGEYATDGKVTAAQIGKGNSKTYKEGNVTDAANVVIGDTLDVVDGVQKTITKGLEITTQGAGEITVYGVLSTGSIYSAPAVLVDADNKILAAGNITKDKEDTKICTVPTFTIPKAGTYRFGVINNVSGLNVVAVKFTYHDAVLNGTTDTTVATVLSNDTYYAIALVSADTAANSNSLTVASGNNTNETNEVFESAAGFEATDLGGASTDYVYAVELTGVTAGKTLENIQRVVTATVA